MKLSVRLAFFCGWVVFLATASISIMVLLHYRNAKLGCIADKKEYVLNDLVGRMQTAIGVADSMIASFSATAVAHLDDEFIDFNATDVNEYELFEKLSKVRYQYKDQEGYLWLASSQAPYKILMHPINDAFVNKKLDEVELPSQEIARSNIYKQVKQIVDRYKENYIEFETFRPSDPGQEKNYFELEGFKPGKSRKYPKVLYLRHIKTKDWIVGTSMLLDQFWLEEQAIKQQFKRDFTGLIWTVIGIVLGISGIAALVGYFMGNSLGSDLNKQRKTLAKLLKGKTVELLKVNRKDEVGLVNRRINLLVEKLREYTSFAVSIKQGNLNAWLASSGEADDLGNALVNMRNSLKEAKLEEQKQKLKDQKRHWTSEGLASFGEILRLNNNDVEKLNKLLIRHLVQYLEINQGGLFVIKNNDDGKPYIEMVSCFAYDRQKSANKILGIKDGLIGRCIQESETIHLTEVPRSYITITSGLGEAPPNCVLIVPIKTNDEIFGALELASFSAFEAYKIEFVEKLGESIASTLSMSNANIRTNRLLEESQRKSAELAQREEELRQSMEDMEMAQAEIRMRETKASHFSNTVNHTMVRADIDSNGKITYANSHFLEALGYTTSEAVGEALYSFIHEYNEISFITIWERVIEGGRHFEGRLNFKTNKGDSLWLVTTLTAVRGSNGNVMSLLLLAIDANNLTN